MLGPWQGLGFYCVHMEWIEVRACVCVRESVCVHYDCVGVSVKMHMHAEARTECQMTLLSLSSLVP